MATINPSNVRPVGKVSDIQGEVRVDAYLTSYSESYTQAPSTFIAGRASSNIPVNNESDKYPIYPRGYFWRDEVRIRPLGGRPVQVGYKVESGQYLAEEWALEHTIDDRQRRNAATPIDLDENGTRLLTGKQMIRADRIWVSQFWGEGKWGLEYRGHDDFTPFNDVTSDPIGLIDEHKEQMAQSTGMEPNTLILGSRVKRYLRSHPDIIDRIKYTQRGIADNAVLAALFDVANVLVARSVYNAAAEGAEDDFEFIANPDSMLLCFIDPAPTLDSPTAIGRFSWTGLIPGQTNDMGGVINRGRDDRAYSDWIHSRQAFDLKKISDDLGIFFSNVIDTTSN